MRNLKKHLDLKLIGFLAIVYAIILLVNLFKNIYLKIHGFRDHYSWNTLIFRVHGEDYVVMLLYICFIAIMSKLMIEKKTKLIYTISFHFFFAFFIGPYIYISTSLFDMLLLGEPYSDFTNFDFFLMKFIAVSDINLTVYVTFVIVIYLYYYFNRLQKAELQKAELQIQLSNTKLSFLKSQLHPHFLFNTLNSIHSLIRNDKKKSQNMLADMSDLLKEMMNTKDKNLIKLQNELLLLNKYLNIKNIRFSDDLKIKLDVANNLENALVPSMLLQPIVENSIKYGYSKNHLQLVLSIKIFKKEEQLIFIIENDGKPLEETLNNLRNNGTGLKNIIERLKTLYADNYTFDMYNDVEGVTTKISIPYKIAEYELVS
jgi:sensor histidine kinase YesM